MKHTTKTILSTVLVGLMAAGSAFAAPDNTEASHLTFMRDEEKLARDIFLVFADMYPQQPVFQQIGGASEQTHTDSLRDKLEIYGLPDPSPSADVLPDAIGVFPGEEWGWYFTEKFGIFTEMGAYSELEALKVGAFLEELDLHDLVECPTVMVNNGYMDPCGLNYTDESALINTLRSLVDGSSNHLRSYVGQIEAITGTPYQAQYLAQAEVDAILGR
jgi:hypothetical protein